jgi:hypothetical protein
MQQVMQRRVMLKGLIAAGVSEWVPDLGYLPTFHAQVVGTGAVTALVRIWARNIERGEPVKLGDITLSGTTKAADVGITDYRYMEYMLELVSISGTGATVNAAMAS